MGMGVEMQALHRSKALDAVGYDARSGTLRVRFRSGGLYDYDGVPPEVFLGLLESAHPWTEWRDEIQSHAYRRLE
jgi:hypothetical protein